MYVAKNKFHNNLKILRSKIILLHVNECMSNVNYNM